MGKVARYLNQLTVGNVFDNPEVLEAYSTDFSALRIKPKLVAFPESTDDIRKLMRFFNQLAAKDIHVAVTARGGGHDTTGACLSNGIVVSTEKLGKLLEIDPRDRLVHVQAGITLKELNTALSVSGLTIPVDGRADDTIGGLISNCLVDNCAGKYGGIQNYVERVEVVLANGECLQTDRLKRYTVAKKASEKSMEGTIYRKLSKIIHDQAPLIKQIGKLSHNLTGYPGIAEIFRRDGLDLAPLFLGAQGTLGIISEVILRATPLKARPTRVIATFRDIGSTLAYMKEIASMKPEKLDLYDLRIIMEARETGKNLDGVIRKFKDGYVVYASFSERASNRIKRIMSIRNKFPRTTKFIFETPENRNIISELENSLTNYLSYVKNGERVPILTDFYLPEYNIPSFLKDLQVLSDKLQLDLNLYGSYTAGNYSLRPRFDLTATDFRKKATTFLKAGAYVIKRQEGQLTGGTPEGRLKAIVANTEIPESHQALYADIKQLFDPNGVLNPDVKLGANSRYTLTHFRSTNRPQI